MTIPQPGELFTVTHNCGQFRVGPYRMVEVLPSGQWLSQKPGDHPNNFFTFPPMECGEGRDDWHPYAEAAAV